MLAQPGYNQGLQCKQRKGTYPSQHSTRWGKLGLPIVRIFVAGTGTGIPGGREDESEVDDEFQSKETQKDKEDGKQLGPGLDMEATGPAEEEVKIEA